MISRLRNVMALVSMMSGQWTAEQVQGLREKLLTGGGWAWLLQWEEEHGREVSSQEDLVSMLHYCLDRLEQTQHAGINRSKGARHLHLV